MFKYIEKSASEQEDLKGAIYNGRLKCNRCENLPYHGPVLNKQTGLTDYKTRRSFHPPGIAFF